MKTNIIAALISILFISLIILIAALTATYPNEMLNLLMIIGASFIFVIIFLFVKSELDLITFKKKKHVK